MKRLLVFVFAVALLGSCQIKRRTDPVADNYNSDATKDDGSSEYSDTTGNPNTGSGGTPVFSIIGTWDSDEYSQDGGNSWNTNGSDVYYVFRDDGTLTIHMRGTVREYHYNLCIDESLYRIELQSSNSESIVNHDCDCPTNVGHPYAFKFSYNTDFTEILQYVCGTGGFNVEKLKKR